MTGRKRCWKSTRTAQSPQTVRTGSDSPACNCSAGFLMFTLSHLFSHLHLLSILSLKCWEDNIFNLKYGYNSCCCWSYSSSSRFFASSHVNRRLKFSFANRKMQPLGCFHCKMNGNLLVCFLWTATTRRASQSRTGTWTTVLWSWTWAKPLWRTVGRWSPGRLRSHPATARFLYKGHSTVTFDVTQRDCLPACLPSMYSIEQFSSSEKLSAGAGRDPREITAGQKQPTVWKKKN